MRHFLCTAALLFGVTVCSNATAELVIYNVDFNTERPTQPGFFNPNYDQADPGGISTKTYSAAAGLDGTTALRVDFDTTSNPFSVSYFTNLASSAVDAPVSANLSDYKLSFDVRIEGFDANDVNTFSQYSIIFGDERYDGTFNATSSFQTVVADLDMLSSAGTGTFAPTDFTGTQQFRVAFLGLPNKFDLDTNNSYFVDNIRLVQAVAIPEPSSFALVGLAAAGLFYRRKRASRKS